ncbi:hypothetical protein TrVE_jg237 [Triparma verrucosa]|uniref:Letm1 RBD domain-containing protein n=1 Tax=Triparma verrucosa TaxID=1606542 RepID=A0A9W7FNC4_9STRA|nr:hypothetical protein TrVE_jg237 [Triparma verrucosa]
MSASLSQDSRDQNLNQDSPIKSLAIPPIPSGGPTSANADTNMIKGFVQGIGATLTKGRRATTQLWTNYNLVKDIRSRYKSDATSVSYDEFSLMQRGVEDRWKVLNVMSLMFFASDVAPYALMFYPTMLPSTFSSRFYVPAEGEETQTGPSPAYIQELVQSDLNRAHAVVESMLSLERSCVKPSFLEGLNPFGKSASQKKMSSLRSVSQIVKNMMHLKPQNALAELEQFAFHPDPTSRKVQRFAHAPKPLISGLAKCNNVGVGPIPLPNFMLRAQLVKHMDKLESYDSYLLSQLSKSPDFLDTLSASCIIELGSDRCVLSTSHSVRDVREGVRTWLENAGRQEGYEGVVVEERRRFVKVLGKAIMLGVNCVQGVREERGESELVREMFRGGK